MFTQMLGRRFHIGLLAASLFFACGDDPKMVVKTPGVDGDTTENHAPVAEVTAPAKVKLGAEITLDASASSDEDGDTLDFLWSEAAGNPANNFLDGVDLTSAVIKFKADQEGTFAYSVRVRDPDGETDTAEVSIIVDKDVVDPTQYAPKVTGVAIAGSFYLLADDPLPTYYIDENAGTLTVNVYGTDQDTDVAKLSSEFAGAVSNGTFITSTKVDANDADGFEVFEGTVGLTDDDANTSNLVTVRIQRVPTATDGLPHAVFVDCENGGFAGGDLGTMANPYMSVQSAYDAAVASTGISADRPDVYIATGTCQEPVLVGFHGIGIYGLFDAADDWRRLTEMSDQAEHLSAEAGRRYKAGMRTTFEHAYFKHVLSTIEPGASNNENDSLLISGISFEAWPNNLYPLNITIAGGASTDSFTGLTLEDNEFVGTVTASTVDSIVGGGVRIKAGQPTAGLILMRRNFFSVKANDDGSVMQAYVVHKQVAATTSAGKVGFHANVFLGAINETLPYECEQGTSRPAAFCFEHYDSSAGSFESDRLYAHRNLFIVTENSADVVVLSAADGKIAGHANVFTTATLTNTLTLLEAATSADAGGELYTLASSYPETAPNLNYAVMSDTDNYLECYTTTGTQFDTGTCDASGNAYTYILDSIFGANLLGTHAWYKTSPAFIDAADINESTSLSAEALWDFFGHYGAIDQDDTPPTNSDYNIGPFESLP